MSEDRLRAAERRKLDALERLLEGEPPWPVGTVARHLKDERDALRARAQKGDEE